MLNLKLRTLEGTWPRTSVGICARMAWVSIGRLLVAIQGTPARKGGVSLGGEVDGRDMRPGAGNTTSAANRTAASKDSTAWACLPATPANMRLACGRRRPASRGNRHCAATDFSQKKRAPRGG